MAGKVTTRGKEGRKRGGEEKGNKKREEERERGKRGKESPRKTKETRRRGKTFRHGQRRERMISTMRSPAREMISPVSSNLTVRITVKPIRVALNIYDAVRRSLIARHGDHRAQINFRSYLREGGREEARRRINRRVPDWIEQPR